MSDPREMSQAGIELLKHHEELRLRAYDDLAPWRELHPGDMVYGTVTIGYGHTRTAEAGMEITREEADRLLSKDLQPIEHGVFRMTEEAELTQNEFDALVSFAFNVGLGALDQSTLLRKLLAGHPREEVAAEFHRWVYSKGKRLSGLERRRRDEANVFLHGTANV